DPARGHGIQRNPSGFLTFRVTHVSRALQRSGPVERTNLYNATQFCKEWSMRRARTLAALVVGAGLVLRPAAVRGQTAIVPPGIPGRASWSRRRPFAPLRVGPSPYCRKILRYRPGALECFWIAERICWAFDPVSRQWSQLPSPEQPIVFPCPDGPEPPVCPRL